MSRFRDCMLLIGLLGSLTVLGCLFSTAIAAVIGLLLHLLLGWDWLAASIVALLVIKFVLATLDLFDSDEKKPSGPPCPHCGEKLRTPKARQCFHCGEKWHDKHLEADDRL